MKQIERELIYFLYENRDHFVTSQELAEVLSVSDRTIRTYLKQIKKTLSENGAEIFAKPGFGYQLEIDSPVAFELFLNQNEISKVLGDHENVEEVKDRQNYILNKLLLEDQALVLEALANRLYVSRSTVSKDLSEIRQLLKSYNLSIESSANKGIWVEGNERNKRQFIMDYFFGKGFSNSFQKYMMNTPYFTEINLEEIAIIILDECRSSKIKLSDFIIQNLVMHLALSVKRLKRGLALENTFTSAGVCSKEYAAARRILERVGSIAEVTFSPNEVDYLALHLMAKSNCGEQALPQNPPALEKELLEALKKIEEGTGFPVAEDLTLKNGLHDHIRPLLVRLEQGIYLENPLLEEIRSDYNEVFQWTKFYLQDLSFFKKYEISDDEWAYLTLHFMASIEKYRDLQKLQTLIICATGLGSAQLLKTRVEKEFGKHLNIVDVRGYYEIDDQILRNVDLIISAIDLSTVVFTVPVIYVSIFLNEKDVFEIREALGVLMEQKSITKTLLSDRSLTVEQKKEFFDAQIHEEFFIRFDKEKSRDEVVEALLKVLEKGEQPSYSIQMKDQIKRRESMGSLVFSETIAVPHPAIPVGKKTKIAVGVVPEGVFWNEEFPKIQWIFLLSPSYFENRGITSITGAICRLCDQPDLQAVLLQQEEFSDFREAFIEIM